jgi:hypothetical protein
MCGLLGVLLLMLGDVCFTLKPSRAVKTVLAAHTPSWLLLLSRLMSSCYRLLHAIAYAAADACVVFNTTQVKLS